MNVQPRRGMHLPKDKNPYSRGTQSANPATEEILVHTDWNLLQICDARTLEPKRLLNYMDIDPELAGTGSCAHPPHDEKEALLLIISSMGPASVWKSPLPCRPCYTHSLAMTDKYVVFVRNPVHLDLSDTTKGFADMMVCEHDSPTEFYILDKSDGKHVATYQVNNFYFFHIGMHTTTSIQRLATSIFTLTLSATEKNTIHTWITVSQISSILRSHFKTEPLSATRWTL
ncbi:Carotenoid isomerooxygenase [Fusarium oxysporum f. sp. raphani]|uniref:Carotenoid isomerooxygenase n=1 Tax=Fusarium oxysporum f. sp. raphani TaxID=96318 RepID=A0A8J5NLS3_FUSOX|nr:Carotenoid isomerooxygenase [Fusarium oxysporum f. sp. raphani]